MAVVILHLSEKEISDLLFVGRLGRFLSVAPRTNGRIIVVHDGYYQAKTVLENDGHDIAHLTQQGWFESADAVFAGIKALTRQVVNGLTDQGIAAVGMQCADRNLVGLRDGQPVCLEPERLSSLADHGVVPVLGPIVNSSAGERSLESAMQICRAIADALAELHVVRIVNFSQESKNTGLRTLSSYKYGAYANLASSVSADLIGVEELADTEFWERFS